MDGGQKGQAPSAFGQLLKRLRTAADLTQEELAERSSVSARLISDIERGAIRRSRRDTVRMLADGLGLTGSDRETFVALARRKADPRPETGSAAASVSRSNVPRPSVELVGREREITATTTILLQPDVRLLTLTGPGGVGKTQLALATTARVAGSFPDGAVFVDLAPVTDPELLLPTIARALGVQSRTGAPDIDQLVDAVQGLRLLLVLDNMEHLIAGAADVARILERCPDLTVLATSRQPLHLRAEREYPVAPLALPDLEDALPLNELGRIPAVDLFVRRAEAVRHAFALTEANARAIAEIAVRLDGLPLAIELAAARVRVISPAELLDRLDQRLPLLTGGALDLPARQRTLRATIDWSHDLLTADEQRLFRQLAVFTGGFSLSAAESLCGGAQADSGPPVEILNSLTSLVDKNLVRTVEPIDHGPDQDTTRFEMLETIREYALEQLSASGEEDGIRARHAAWCLELAEQSEWELVGPEQARWFARLEIENDNLRAALRWAIDNRQAEIAQFMCGALWRFWSSAGLYAEGRRWTEAALDLCRDAPPTRARARAFNAAGTISSQQGDVSSAEQYYLQALATYQALEDRTGIAYSYGNLGVISDNLENYDEARSRYERALAEFRELDDQVHIGAMLGNLGLIAYFQGDYDRATALIHEGLENTRARQDLNGQAINLGNLGLVAIARGNLDEAEATFRESFEIRRTLPNPGHMARCLDNFALLAAARRQYRRAAHLYAAAAALRVEIGTSLPPNDRAFNENVIAEVRAQIGERTFSEAWETGVLMPLDEAAEYALAREAEGIPHTRGSSD